MHEATPLVIIHGVAALAAIVGLVGLGVSLPLAAIIVLATFGSAYVLITAAA